MISESKVCQEDFGGNDRVNMSTIVTTISYWTGRGRVVIIRLHADARNVMSRALYT